MMAWRHRVAWGGVGWCVLEPLIATVRFVAWNGGTVVGVTAIGLLAVAFVGVTVGVPCDIVLSTRRRFSLFAHVTSALVTALGVYLLLVFADFGTEGSYLERRGFQWMYLVAAAVRLAMLPGLVSSWRARLPRGATKTGRGRAA